MEKPDVSQEQEQPDETDQGAIYTYNEDDRISHTKLSQSHKWWRWTRKHLNFFRIFLLCFIFVPLLTSVIFWAVSTEFKIDYIDCLYLSYSAITNTGMLHLIPFVLILTFPGLSPIDLSHTTTLQQAMMFIEMAIGCPIFISWIVVMVRK